MTLGVIAAVVEFVYSGPSIFGGKFFFSSSFVSLVRDTKIGSSYRSFSSLLNGLNISEISVIVSLSNLSFIPFISGFYRGLLSLVPGS